MPNDLSFYRQAYMNDRRTTRKRRRDKGTIDSSGDYDTKTGDTNKLKKTSQVLLDEDRGRRFACPFYKRDLWPNHWACVVPGFHNTTTMLYAVYISCGLTSDN
jgi:hypothetical protein